MDSAPRKVPKRSKKRSIHFSQLEKKSKKKPFGFNKTSWILLAFNLIQVAALVVVVLAYSGDGDEGEHKCEVGRRDNTLPGSPDSQRGTPFQDMDSKSIYLVQSINQYLGDLFVGGDNFTRDFGAAAQPTQTKITPPWELNYLRDDTVGDYFPSLAPSNDNEQVFLSAGGSQVLAIYERELNLTLSAQTICYFTNFAVGTATQVVGEDGGKGDGHGEFALSTVQHYEQEGYCNHKYYAGEGDGTLLGKLSPFVRQAIGKTERHACNSFEEFRVAIVQDLLAITEATARTPFTTAEEDEIVEYASQYFAKDVTGYVRGATGEYRLYQDRMELVRALFRRNSFIPLRHKVIAQNFDVSVVSEIQVVDASGKQEWYDSAFYEFTGENAKTFPPTITKVFYSFHN